MLWPQVLQELKMTSSMASYEQLVRQVEALKAENSHLRQELRDNSSHLSKLETETSGMKVGAGRRAWLGHRKSRSTRAREAGGPGWSGWALCPRLSSLPQEVLKRLQGKLEQEARVLVSSGQTEVLEQLKGEGGAGPAHRELGLGAGGALTCVLVLLPTQLSKWTSPACTTSSSSHLPWARSPLPGPQREARSTALGHPRTASGS